MSYSHAYRWSIALLIPLAVAWKIAVPPVASYDLRDDIAEFLTRNRFNVVAADKIINADRWLTDVPIIQATRDSCRLLIARLNFDGSNQQLVESRLAGTDRQFIIFRGKIYARQPILLTLTNHLWSRFLGVLGLSRRSAPTIAIGSNASCEAASLPWGDLPW